MSGSMGGDKIVNAKRCFATLTYAFDGLPNLHYALTGFTSASRHNNKTSKSMSFEHHTEDDCDRCNKHIRKENLVPLPFLYKDMNDKFHEDKGGGYRQYVVCKDCMEVERKIKEEKTKETLMKMSEGMDFFKVPNFDFFEDTSSAPKIKMHEGRKSQEH